MTTLWNPDFLKRYQKSFSEAVVAKAFANKESLSGKDLLRLTPCKQVNFFVMKSLFSQWQDEMRRLESPYFDYRAPEVKKAMVQFMNTLSQNISVGKEDLEGLLEASLEQSILIVVDPAAFVRAEFEGRGEAPFSAKQSRQLLKYIKVLETEFHQLLLDKGAATNGEVVEHASEQFAALDVTEARAKLLGELNEVAAISLDDVLAVSLEPDELPEDFELAEEEPPVEAIESEEEEPTVEIFDGPPVEPAADHVPVTEEEEEESRPATINEQFQKPADPPLVEHLQQTDRVASILESISLNQRYMFTQELFSGDANAFQEAIGEIEHERTFDEAVEHLVTNYAANNEWDMNSEVVKELLKAVFRKFR